MNEILHPWQLLLAILSGWIHHRKQKMIEFQNDQIASLLKAMRCREGNTVIDHATVTDLNGRPRYLLDPEYRPLPELV